MVKRGGNGVAWELDLRAVTEWQRGEKARDQAEADAKLARDGQLKLSLLGDDALPDPFGGGENMTAKARSDAIRAELDKAKLAQLRRELVRADEVRDDLAATFAVIRDRLRTLPDDLGRRYGLASDQIEDCVEMVDDLLNGLADTIDTLPSLRIASDDELLAGLDASA